MAPPTAKPENKAEGGDSAPAGDAAAGHRQHVPIDDASVQVTYANFCRLSLLPEELALDFGLNMQGLGAPPQPVKVTQRIVLSYHSSKRLVGLLQAVLQRHEATFGPLELDVQKRAQAAQGRPPA